MRPLHAQLWRRLSFSNHEANDQTGIDFRGENASIQTYRDVETGQCPCDVRNAHARRDFLIGNDERTGGKPPFGLRPTVGTSTHVPSSWHEQSTQYEGATRPQQGGPTAHLPAQAAYDYERECQGQPWTPPSLPHSSTASYDVSPSGPLVSATSSSATSSTTQDPFDTSSKLQSLNLSMRKTMIASSNSGPCSGPSSSGIDCPHAFWLAAVVPYLIWRCFYSERSS